MFTDINSRRASDLRLRRRRCKSHGARGGGGVGPFPVKHQAGRQTVWPVSRKCLVLKCLPVPSGGFLNRRPQVRFLSAAIVDFNGVPASHAGFIDVAIFDSCWQPAAPKGTFWPRVSSAFSAILSAICARVNSGVVGTSCPKDIAIPFRAWQRPEFRQHCLVHCRCKIVGNP